MSAPRSGANHRDSTTDPVRPLALRQAALRVLAALALPVAAAAQFASGVTVVEVYATVTDAAGDPVLGLTRDDFVVRESGAAQQVTTFAAGEFPLTAAVALDRSFSMAGERLAIAKSAARAFLAELRPADESLLIGIGSEVETIAPRSTDRPAQYAALSKLDSFGTTSLHDAILAALDALRDARGRRALVLLSDGDDRFSKATPAEVLARARRTDVLVYPVALGRARPSLFAELATVTGARSFHVRAPKQLPDTLRTIARELRYQYLLGYSPARPAAPGGEEWRPITVTVNRPGVRVRARDGYFAR